MARSPLTESINRVRRLVVEIQNTLTVDEFNLLLDELIPEPEPVKKPTKKASKKAGKKSARAASLSEKIQGTVGKPHLGEGPVCGICSHTKEYEDHFKPSPHYHPFQPPASTAAHGSTPASSGIDGDGVGSVAREQSSSAGG